MPVIVAHKYLLIQIRDRIRSIEGITRSTEADQGTIHESVAVAVCEDIEQTKVRHYLSKYICVGDDFEFI